MATIQIRIDEDTKNKAKKIFEDLGLDMSSGIKLFLKQVINYKGIPFQLLTENGFTPEREDEILEASEEAKRGENVSKMMTGKEAIDYLKSIENDN